VVAVPHRTICQVDAANHPVVAAQVIDTGIGAGRDVVAHRQPVDRASAINDDHLVHEDGVAFDAQFQPAEITFAGTDLDDIAIGVQPLFALAELFLATDLLMRGCWGGDGSDCRDAKRQYCRFHHRVAPA
jgi:hypothetical protein